MNYAGILLRVRLFANVELHTAASEQDEEEAKLQK